MKIALITPEPPADQSGNETTSERWADILSGLGHEVEIAYELEALDLEPELLVALHALKTDDAVTAYRRAHPERPLVVALTGTDLYRYRNNHREVDANIERADALVVLQQRALDELPADARKRAFVAHQSVGLLDEPVPATEVPEVGTDSGAFDVVVAAHLRDVKDPLRTARAARELPEESGIRVTHVGRALGEDWEERAADEVDDNPRYRWLGEVDRPVALGVIRDADLLCVTSRLEGGPNVISEAVALGTPVVATRIPGNVGLLGDDYPGYVEPEETDALTAMLRRLEDDEALYRRLVEACETLQPRFEPGRERSTWRELIGSLTD